MIGFATIGTSKITEKFLGALKESGLAELKAVYSRNLDKAVSFAARHGADKFYDNLDDLVKDREVDAVYVASPNYMHYRHVMKLLCGGKHVICEKALASNYAEAAEMVRTAREKNLILMEAVRPIFDPGMEAVRDGMMKLGVIRRADIRYCQYSSRYDSFKEGQEHNIFSRECSAGSLMDIGVYCVHTLLYLLGMPEKITGFSTMLRGDIDGDGVILAKYPDKIASVSYSKITDSVLPNELQGENGTLIFSGTSNSPENVKIIYRDKSEEVLYHREPLNDMKYELELFTKMVTGAESPEIHMERSLNAMKIMDEMRKQSGIIFPADER